MLLIVKLQRRNREEKGYIKVMAREESGFKACLGSEVSKKNTRLSTMEVGVGKARDY